MPRRGPLDDESGFYGCASVSVVIFFVALAAWATHVWVCFKLGETAFLFWGAFLFPMAIFHGFGLWLGLCHH